MHFVTKLFIRHLQNPRHHFIVKVDDQISHKDNAVTHLGGSSAGYLARPSDQIINRFIFCRNSYSPIHINNRLQEFFIECLLPFGNFRIVFVQDELKK